LRTRFRRLYQWRSAQHLAHVGGQFEVGPAGLKVNNGVTSGGGIHVFSRFRGKYMH
jgi:hypothetical protein